MKKTLSILVLAIAALLTAPSCISQAKVFKDAASLPDVTSVYIGPALLKMAGSASTMGGYGDYSQYVSGVKNLEILTCESPRAIDRLATVCDSIISTLHYEVMLDANEDNEHTVIYAGVPDQENPSVIEGLLIVNREKNEYNLVFIRGKIDIGKMASDFSKNKDADDDGED